MSTLGIDYSEIGDPSVKSGARSKGRSKRGRRQLWLPVRVVWWAVLAVVLAVLPFLLLIRGGVFAHHHWGLAPWLALAISATATTLLLALYALRASRRIGAGKGLTRAMTRAATLLAGAYVVYSVMFVAGGNVKSGEVRAEYTALHPLLRLGASALILTDSDAVITDAGRTPDFYRRMGLSPNESSLHFEQESGFVHALDLRTIGRPEWRNRAAEIAFRAMGFHSLRHVGTADHLHVSLRLPR